MQLTTHFSLSEFTRSPEGERHGINNTPNQQVILNLKVVAEGLEKVRDILEIHNSPIFIDSGYRCPTLNALVNGAKDSAHMRGFAADFICPSWGTPLDICRKIADSSLQFDQLIQEGSWVHISFDPRMRRQVLTARFDDAHVSYVSGL